VSVTRHTREEVHDALSCFAMESGKEALVVPLLEEAGLDVRFQTLRNWTRGTHKDLYQQIKSEVDKTLRVEMGDKYVSLAKTSASLIAKVLDQLEKRVDEGADTLSIAELNKIAHESSVVTGITYDKALKAQGQPDIRIEHTAPDIARALKARGVSVTVDGQVLEEETVGEIAA
jgi:hypothetical protein